MWVLQVLCAERSLLDERHEVDSQRAELEELKKERVVMLEYIQELAEKCAKLEREVEERKVTSDAQMQVCGGMRMYDEEPVKIERGCGLSHYFRMCNSSWLWRKRESRH